MKNAILISALLFCFTAMSNAQRGIPKNNWSMYAGWTGVVDTKMDFDDFFHQDFTLTAWVMPQYPYAYAGPIFANKGDGIFMAGQGDFIWGTGGHQKLHADGSKYTTSGQPVFFIQVGNAKATYLVPEFTAGKWVHVAVVRSNNQFRLFIDGKHIYPKKMQGGDIIDANAPEVTASGNYGLKPEGTLRFGRAHYWRGQDDKKVEITKMSKRYDIRHYQFYGMIDDVGLFDKALTGSELTGLKYSSKRLDGYEDHLKAGWIFDKVGSTNISPKLKQSWTVSGNMHTMPVSKDRNSKQDDNTFMNFMVMETSVALKLPFPKNENWKVIQGYNSNGGSHHGYAAFAYDFKPAEESGSYAKVYAPADVKVSSYSMDEQEPGPDSKNEKNYVKFFLNPAEFILMEHMAYQSQNSVITGGDYDDNKNKYTFPTNAGPAIASEGFVAKLGPNAKHLHFSTSSEAAYGPTFPIPFSSYEMSEDNGKTWVQVVLGYPKNGQWIRRKL